MTQKKTHINRIEVIDWTKDEECRVFTKWDDNIKVELSYQDNGKTLKVFITKT